MHDVYNFKVKFCLNRRTALYVWVCNANQCQYVYSRYEHCDLQNDSMQILESNEMN